MQPKDLVPWLTLLAAMLAAGMWLGRLQQQVNDLVAEQHYLHGDVHVPDGAK